MITRYIEFETAGDGDVIDITSETSEAVRESGVESGAAIVFVPGATGAVTTIEHEPGLVEDMKRAMERWAPREIEYSHDRRWGDGNGHSHIRAALIGPSLTVPFNARELMLGTWQQIVFIDLDNRPRRRRVVVQILGE